MSDRIKLDYETPESVGPFDGLAPPPTTLQRGLGCAVFLVCGVFAFACAFVLLVEGLDLPLRATAWLVAVVGVCAWCAIRAAVNFSRLG